MLLNLLKMKKIILNYSIAFFIVLVSTLILIDFVLLPTLANSKKELFMPDVKGMNVDDVYELLENFSISLFYIDYIEGYQVNEVLSTSPRAYTKVKEGREIKVTVIADKKDIIINDFISKSLRNANLFLDRNNITLDTIIYEYSEKYNRNKVISQYPKEGNKIKDNSKVTLIVSLGNPPDYYIVPDLINVSLNKGKIKIRESGLLIGKLLYEYVDTLLNNTIIQQDQPAYKRLSMPLEINLTISKDK